MMKFSNKTSVIKKYKCKHIRYIVFEINNKAFKYNGKLWSQKAQMKKLLY